MIRSFPALLVGFSLALPLMAEAQTTAPALPAAPAAPVPSQAAPAQGTGQITTLKTRSSLVVLDVVVSDKSHRPVHGLKATDFQVREAGVAQTVKSIEEHVPTAPAKPGPEMGPLPPGVFSNYTPLPDNGPINVLLIDRLNTPIDAQVFLHQQLVDFMKKMKPGTRLAVFGLNRQLIFLQGVSSDPKVLLAALESKQNGVKNPVLRPSDSDTSASDALNTIDTNPGAEVMANVQQFEAQNQSFQTQLRVHYTLDALNVLARYLSALPGRKNLIWFSGSFPISILPDAELRDPTAATNAQMQNPFAAVADMSDEFRETTGLLSKAQVAVYPIDARGLQGPSVMRAEEGNSKYAKSPAAFSKALRTEDATRTDEHSTMLQMASETGGEAFVNTNALADAVAKSIDHGSSYYTITYTPSDPKSDGSFRKIQVAATTGSYNLDYRHGYYSDMTGKKERTQLTSSPTAPPTLSPRQIEVRNSMLRGAPTPSEIIFKVYVAPLGPDTDPVVSAGNSLSETTKGPFRRYTVNYAASPADIGFKNVAPGKFDLELQFLVYVYDANGERVNAQGNVIKATVTPENVKNMLQTGLQFHQAISVPAKGDYFLRIGIHDMQLDRVGAVEIPVASVKNLPVVEIPKPKPAAPTLSDLPK